MIPSASRKGIRIARGLLLFLANLGLPAATEALDPIMPQYLSELVTWTAIGARTTESQTHREMASGLSMPVGFKNGTDGSLAVAINALHSARHPHHFLGITQRGQSAVFRTTGNRYGHVVLRGGGGRSNYDAENVARAERELDQAGLPRSIMVDCSHGNSNKEPARQLVVAESVAAQILDGNRSIVGLMLESNLEAGSQAIPANPSELRYGVSVTDPCLDWAATENLLRSLDSRLRTAPRFAKGNRVSSVQTLRNPVSYLSCTDACNSRNDCRRRSWTVAQSARSPPWSRSLPARALSTDAGRTRSRGTP